MSPGQLSGARVTIGGSREREGSKAGSISEIHYLQYSRALFLISILFMLISLGLLLSSCRPAERMMSAELDLKVSMLSFCSGMD